MGDVPPARIFAALGDPTRLALVTALARGDSRSIAELSAGSALTRQAITKHLRVLEGAGLVHGLRAGRETLFALEPARVEAAQCYLADVSRQWEDALSRLRTFVEDSA